jgi:hypothetical protein
MLTNYIGLGVSMGRVESGRIRSLLFYYFFIRSETIHLNSDQKILIHARPDRDKGRSTTTRVLITMYIFV